MTFVKSPLNYVGGKFKLLPQIVPHFPKDIITFIDLFGGGANVTANVDANFIYYNDKQKEVVELLEYIYGHEIDDLLAKLDEIIAEYSLSKTNSEGFLKLREDYNAGYRHQLRFYALVTHAFNYQIRFNSKGEYNMPFGKERSSFNPSLRQKFIAFHEALTDRSIYFTSQDFRQFDVSKLDSDDFVYVDPPYLVSTAAYNENGGWSTKDENDLLALLNDLNARGVRFALSNVLEHKGATNEILTEWLRKYNVIDLDANYANCNYQTKRGKSREVLITNY